MECSEGQVLDPLDYSSLPQVYISRFGVIPKGKTSKWCLIVDISSPEGQSVNNGIWESLCSLFYVTIGDSAPAMAAKSGYRNVPIHPHNWWLVGKLWEGSSCKKLLENS